MTGKPTAGASDDRARYINGLHDLAWALEAHPEIPLPFAGREGAIRIDFWGDPDQIRDAMAAASRALPVAAWRKKVGGDGDEWLDLEGDVAGLKISLSGARAAVCKRVVTGTREVTEEVPDPEAPKIKRTRTVEDVEWDCGSLLSPGAETPAESAS